MTHECEYPPSVCVVQSFIGTTGLISSFIWTIIIAWEVRESLLKNSPSWMDRFQWILHVIAWGVPLTVTAIIARYQRLGFIYSPDRSIGGTAFTAGWCWIKICQADFDRHDLGLMVGLPLAAGKVWEIFVYFTVPVIYTALRWNLKSTIRQTESMYVDRATQDAVSRADRVMKAIPIIFIFLRIWGTIRFVANSCYWVVYGAVENPTFHTVVNVVLAVFQAFGDNGQGIGNCLIYCFLTDSVRVRICAVCGLRPETADFDSIRDSLSAAILDHTEPSSGVEIARGSSHSRRSTPLSSKGSTFAKNTPEDIFIVGTPTSLNADT
ncbi:G-protein coupled receptor 157-like [Lingula anatina]|uniref:G-protein coupled receptor 157-like n=1 Tax=Lingula anatina TaxID=7574 RepID=A0A1S3IRM3_LINAN|nr:G-protein coupled receptor 157-like [Lingula anatina]|eukprot:XP_013400857.1 G-protein coupled receptor 157-like [Lingula anatina]